MAHVNTSVQRRLAALPLACGISPRAAERLRARGIDPEQHAQAIRASTEFRERPRMPQAAMLSARGRGLELNLDPSDVRVQSILQQAAMLWRNGKFVADEMAPVQMVAHRSDKYLLWGRDDQMTVPDDRIGPNGTAKEVTPTLSDDNFSVTDRGLAAQIPLATDAENPSIALRARTVENVRERLALARELRVATLYFSTSSYGSDNRTALTSTRKWNGGSTATPVADVLTALEAIPAEVTHSIMSDITWHVVQQADEIKAILASQLNNQGLLRVMDWGLYFGIPTTLIQKSYYRDATTGLITRIWSETDIAFAHIQQGNDVLTFARTFRLMQGAGGFVTQNWFDPKLGTLGAEWSRVAYSDDEKVVASDFGYLLGGVVQ